MHVPNETVKQTFANVQKQTLPIVKRHFHTDAESSTERKGGTGRKIPGGLYSGGLSLLGDLKLFRDVGCL